DYFCGSRDISLNAHVLF
nr:immunoglobulin light chain junction region [Macaca mulatta]